MRKFGFNFLLVLSIVTVLSGFLVTTAGAQSNDTAKAGVFYSNAVAPGQIIEMPVEVRNVADLYAIDIELHFDPAILQVEDADPNTAGVQVALGTFLDAGLILYNTVDNAAGKIHVVMTQTNPSEGKTGDGVALVIYLRGAGVGTSDLTVTFLECASRTGEAIAVEPQNASVQVIEGAAPQEATAIPVQDPGDAVLIPTSQPTSTPSIASTPEAKVEIGSDEAVSQDADATISATTVDRAASEAEDAQEKAGFNLLSYWWVLLLVVAGAIFLVIFQARSRK